MRSQGKVGEPLVVEGLDLSLGIRLAFQTFDQVEECGQFWVSRVGQVFSPVILLNNLAFFHQTDFL